MNQKIFILFVLIAFVCINQFEASPSDCSCGWANGGRSCGHDDGSKCWKECCGKRKRSVLDGKYSEPEQHFINQ